MKTPNIKYILVGRNNVTDWNDCCVYALASAMNISYEDAHTIWQREGRNEGKGIFHSHLSEFLREVGFTLLPDTNLSVEDTCKLCAKGRYFVRTKNHAFAVVDGVVYDCNQPTIRYKIERIYRYEK